MLDKYYGSQFPNLLVVQYTQQKNFTSKNESEIFPLKKRENQPVGLAKLS